MYCSTGHWQCVAADLSVKKLYPKSRFTACDNCLHDAGARAAGCLQCQIRRRTGLLRCCIIVDLSRQMCFRIIDRALYAFDPVQIRSLLSCDFILTGLPFRFLTLRAESCQLTAPFRRSLQKKNTSSNFFSSLWQATKCPGSTSTSFGGTRLQSSVAI